MAKDPTRGYEFGAIENQAFTRLALTMQLVALAQLVGALMAAVAFGPRAVEALGRGAYASAVVSAAYVLVPALIGAWTLRAGGHLRQIVRTQGDDVTHLMSAVGELTKLYLLQLGVVLAGVAVGASILAARV